MLRFATNQTSRALFRSRTIPRVAQSVRHHSAGVTEEAMGVFPTLAMMGTTVLLGSSILEQRRWDKNKIEIKQKKIEIEQKIIEIEQEQREIESEKARQDNARQMSVEWSSMHPSRKAVLNKRNKNNLFSTLRKLLGMANNSKADETTPVPDDVADVINFFLLWKNHRDDDTIDSTRLKKYIKSEFRAFRDTLKDIRDDEARDWDEADSDILNEVVDFLDDISKMETKGSGEP